MTIKEFKSRLEDLGYYIYAEQTIEADFSIQGNYVIWTGTPLTKRGVATVDVSTANVFTITAPYWTGKRDINEDLTRLVVEFALTPKDERETGSDFDMFKFEGSKYYTDKAISKIVEDIKSNFNTKGDV